MSVEVHLTQAEHFLSIVAGGFRTERARRKGQERQYDADGGLKVSYHQDITAAGAELAAARVIGAYPLGLAGQRLPDLIDSNGDEWEVRHHQPHDGHLIVRTRDIKDSGTGNPKPNVRFIYVTGAFLDFKVHGWAWRDDVVDPRYEQTFPGEDPSYWMPIEDLTEFSSVLAVVP